jgi:hypothetical protein
VVTDPQANANATAGNGPDRTLLGGILQRDVRGLLLDQEDRAREFIRAHPLGVVLCALVFGYVAARLVRED